MDEPMEITGNLCGHLHHLSRLANSQGKYSEKIGCTRRRTSKEYLHLRRFVVKLAYARGMGWILSSVRFPAECVRPISTLAVGRFTDNVMRCDGSVHVHLLTVSFS